MDKNEMIYLNYEIKYKKTCENIIKKINENINNNWYFEYWISKNNDNRIILENQNRIWVIYDFENYKQFYYFLLWISKFFNLYFNNIIDFDKKSMIE